MNKFEIDNKKKENRGRSRIYVLQSESQPDIIKVGVTTNNARVPHFAPIGYGNITDWKCIYLLWNETKEIGETVEKMVETKLTNMGVKLPEIRWTNLRNGDENRGAREIYKADADEVINIINSANECLGAWLSKPV